MLQIKPIHANVLVRPFEAEKETAAGLIIPPSAQERPSKATIVAVGDGLKDRPMVLKEGDVVFHVKNCGTPVVYEGEVLYFMKDADILSYIRNN